jgi:glycosyltransferase involved in cell wall biosynthesis
MHIAIDALLLKNQNGGTGVYTHSLLSAIATASSPHRFTVFVDGNYEYSHDFICPHIAIQKIYFNNGIHRVLWEQTAFVQRLNRLNPDLLFCPFFIKPVFYGGKTVITLHDLYHRLIPQAIRWDKRLYRRFFIDASMRQSRHIIAISELTKRDAMSEYGVNEGFISVVYNGIDDLFRRALDAATRQAVLKKLAIPFDKFLLSVSAQHRNKNFGQLLEAVWKLKQQGKFFPLVIAGNKGDDSEHLSRLVAAYQLGELVKFVGFVGNDDLPALYQSASVFILPSLYEGFGLPLVEAMASGIPVIYANRGALPETANGAGQPFSTTEELCRSILLLWDDGALRNHLIQSGLARSAQFSWRQTAQRTLAVFEGLSENKA